MAAQDHMHSDARTLGNLAATKRTNGLAQQLLVFGHRKIRWWLRPTSSRCRLARCSRSAYCCGAGMRSRRTGRLALIRAATSASPEAQPSSVSTRASMAADEMEPSSPSSVVTRVPLGPPPSLSGRTPWFLYQANFVAHFRR
jgi:hypothetical protein